MPKYTITIFMDNAAFEDNGEGMEISNILSMIALQCREYRSAVELRLKDSNGNFVGEAQVDNE